MNKREGRSWQEAREDLLADRETLAEYERLRPQYELIGQIIGARVEQGITQAQLAERVGTKQTNISRLERGCMLTGIFRHVKIKVIQSNT